MTSSHALKTWIYQLRYLVESRIFQANRPNRLPVRSPVNCTVYHGAVTTPLECHNVTDTFAKVQKHRSSRPNLKS